MGDSADVRTARWDLGGSHSDAVAGLYGRAGGLGIPGSVEPSAHAFSLRRDPDLSFLVSPDFFLLEEPYTYLDSHSIKILNNLIEQSSKKGKSFLIADNSSGILNFTGSVGL